MIRTIPAAFPCLAGALIAFHAAAQPRQEFPVASPESVGLSTKALQQLDDAVKSYITRDEAVGTELLIIKGRKTVWHTAHGLADRDEKRPLQTGSIFCVRSMTKPFVGTAAQMLIDEGRLSLDDHAAKFLPAFDHDKHKDITVAHLLTHTSGLPLSSLISTNHQTLTGIQDVADLAANATLVTDPGEKYNYSDDGTDTLTAIVEKVSGQPIADFLQQRILDPLGMRDTMPVSRKGDPRRAKMIPLYVGATGAWTRHWSPTPDADPLFPYFLGSQSMYSTCEDYARFLCLWADSGQPKFSGAKRLLSPAAVTRGLTPAREMGYPCGFTGLRTDYGQLWMLWVDPAKTPLKRIAFGHGGSDGTQAWMWPDQDLIVLYFTQSRGGLTVVSFERELDRALFGGKAETAQSFTPFLGVYWDPEKQRYRAIVERDGKLNVEIPGQFFGTLAPGDKPDQWALELAPQIKLSFTRAAGGRATALDLDNSREVAHLVRVGDAHSPDLPALDAVIARVLKAHGTENMNTIGAIRRTGTFDMPARKVHLTMAHLMSGPRMRVELSNNGTPAQTIFNDGTHVWSQTAAAKAEPLAAALEEQTRLEHPINVFGDWRKTYKEVAVIGRTTVEGDDGAPGTPAIVVRCVPALGYPTAFYVSEESGLVIGQDKFSAVAGLGVVGAVARFQEYRDVAPQAGAPVVKLPFKTVTAFANPILGESIITIESAEAGGPTDPGAFAPPASP